MPDRIDGLAAFLTAGVSERLRDVVGNSAILGAVALLALTAWVAGIAGLVVVLAPLWGMALAIFFVVALAIVTALVLLAMLRRRTRQQEARAAYRQVEARRKGRAALLAALPGVVRNRPGALLVGSGLVLGAMLIAVLQAGDEEQEPPPDTP